MVRLGVGLQAGLLTEEKIIEAARAYHKEHGSLPVVASQEEVPGMAGKTWGALNAAGRLGLRGLTKGRTLSVILAPLREELGRKMS